MPAMPSLPPPSTPDGTPAELVTELGARVGEITAATWCAALLAGADVHDYAGVLPYLGSNCARAAFDPSWRDYWHRTWGGRGLLYVWTDAASDLVVSGLYDENWRPAEMCLKVATKREIGEAAPGAVLLATHELVRVRSNAVRCLGVVGDTEHVSVVQAALGDEDPAARRAAARALRLLVSRLDLDLPDLDLPGPD